MVEPFLDEIIVADIFGILAFLMVTLLLNSLFLKMLEALSTLEGCLNPILDLY